MAVVIALAAIGAYASKLQYGDVWMMVVFGALAYVLRRLDFPLAPLVLGLVLGRMFDEFLRIALIISGGSLAPLCQRPICLVLLFVLVAFLPAQHARGPSLAGPHDPRPGARRPRRRMTRARV